MASRTPSAPAAGRRARAHRAPAAARPPRVVIEAVEPAVDGGRFAAKRIAGEALDVEAHVFADGHDELAARLLHRREGTPDWRTVSLAAIGNDRWQGSFPLPEMGRYQYTVQAWVDRFATWSHGLAKKAAAGQDVAVDLRIGAGLVEEAAVSVKGRAARQLLQSASVLRAAGPQPDRVALATSAELATAMAAIVDPADVVSYDRELTVVADRPQARFSTWYEAFPRSCASEPGRHGTLRDCAARLPYVAEMGFDILYLPPIHPIGRTHRKGKNNATTAAPDEPGSPWAIGSDEGGHKAIDPRLGTVDDFRFLVEEAAGRGIEVALDIALQCSPDHPYVREHPEWFRWRPDGTVQYAENPPKKYEDIYPFDFETADWRGLWEEIKSIFSFWIAQGVRVFRVDNPHTKPFAFWEWLIAEVHRDRPDVIFLAEAFTRPRIMYRLAKLGFTQSYTYFAWRNRRRDIEQYFTELTTPPVRDFFRPNLWPNTPDILNEYLQEGGRPAFMARVTLAATLGASYGIYGPAFELCLDLPRQTGSEEYLDSEKYEVRHWDLEAPHSLRHFIGRLNRIRRQQPCLQDDRGLAFHRCDNEHIVCYSKSTSDLSNVVLVTVNLDSRHRHSAWLDLDLEALGLTPEEPFQVHDLLTDARYTWQGARNYVELDPLVVPAHVFLLRRLRTDREVEGVRGPAPAGG